MRGDGRASTCRVHNLPLTLWQHPAIACPVTAPFLRRVRAQAPRPLAPRPRVPAAQISPCAAAPHHNKRRLQPGKRLQKQVRERSRVFARAFANVRLGMDG
ncbi:hypothetical protein EON67_01995 [archaeon]|nr:MAG: hypothetical protein EON67_01995 [archaeon]